MLEHFSHFIVHITQHPLQQAARMQELGAANWQPLVDIYECEDFFRIIAEIPDVDKHRINVSVQDNILRIAGVRYKRVPDTAQSVVQMEIPHGEFARLIELPKSLDADALEAEYENGYLTLQAPKKRHE